MINCNDKTKKCIIVGEEDKVLNEFSMICYGLRCADYSEDDICKAVGDGLARFEIIKDKRSK